MLPQIYAKINQTFGEQKKWTIIISFTDFITKKPCLSKPWTLPVESESSAKHILNFTSLDLKNHSSINLFNNFALKRRL
jgi:hypothetical protein